MSEAESAAAVTPEEGEQKSEYKASEGAIAGVADLLSADAEDESLRSNSL